MTVTVYSYGPSTNNIRGSNSAQGYKAMLLSSSYVPNANIHAFRSDISTYEITANGYTAGGNTLTGVAWTYDATTKQTTMTAQNPTWGAMPATNVRYVAIYGNTQSAPTDFLMCYVDLGQTVDMTAQGLTVVWPSNGVYRLRVDS